MAYFDSKGKSAPKEKQAPKLDLHPELTGEETTEHRTAYGRLARVGKGTLLISTCLASMTLSGKKKAVALVHRC